jgi:hypothetical protein
MTLGMNETYRLKGIRVTAVGIVSCSGGVGGSVALSTWLNPDEGILERITSVGGWTDTETGSDNIAPITPSLLSGWLNTVTGYQS